MKLRGFITASPEQRRAWASKGGKAGGHRWTSEEARAAGDKGRSVSAANRQARAGKR